MRKIDDLTDEELYLLGDIVFQYNDLDLLKKNDDSIYFFKTVMYL